MIDGDLVRVDLLRVKRKLFAAYPEGSKERQDFLAAVKLSEITYLSKLVSPDVAELVFEEHDKIIKNEVIDIALLLGLGVAVSWGLFILHQIFPQNIWLNLFSAPFWITLAESSRHVWHIIEQLKSIKPFKNEYATLSARIKKLSEELRNMK